MILGHQRCLAEMWLVGFEKKSNIYRLFDTASMKYVS